MTTTDSVQLIKVTGEMLKTMKPDESGIKWLQGNTEGWANFLACLKAWLEYGINYKSRTI